MSLYTVHYEGDIILPTELGGAFSNIGVYEPQQTASIAFVNFGDAHKSVELS